MSSKRVSIETTDQNAYQAVVAKGLLSGEFAKAFTSGTTAEINISTSSQRFSYSVSYDDFKSLVKAGAWSPAIVAAFQKSDARLERKSSLQKIWDDVRSSVIYCPTNIEGNEGLQVVVVKCCGLAT
jgi:hypothetical protein